MYCIIYERYRSLRVIVMPKVDESGKQRPIEAHGSEGQAGRGNGACKVGS